MAWDAQRLRSTSWVSTIEPNASRSRVASVIFITTTCVPLVAKGSIALMGMPMVMQRAVTSAGLASKFIARDATRSLSTRGRKWLLIVVHRRAGCLPRCPDHNARHLLDESHGQIGFEQNLSKQGVRSSPVSQFWPDRRCYKDPRKEHPNLQAGDIISLPSACSQRRHRR